MTEPHTVEAACHCGNVRVRFPGLPESLVSCNCSICHRLGSLWAHYTSKDVSVDCDRGATETYVWGDEQLAFHHCPSCGCATHYTTTEKAQGDRVGVNCRMVDPALIEGIRIRRFDGADSWTFLDD